MDILVSEEKHSMDAHTTDIYLPSDGEYNKEELLPELTTLPTFHLLKDGLPPMFQFPHGPFLEGIKLMLVSLELMPQLEFNCTHPDKFALEDIITFSQPHLLPT